MVAPEVTSTAWANTQLTNPTRALSVTGEERPLLETNNEDKEPKGTEMVGASFLFNPTRVTSPSSPFHPLTGRHSWSPARARQGPESGFQGEPLCMEQRRSAERVYFRSDNHKLDNNSCEHTGWVSGEQGICWG